MFKNKEMEKVDIYLLNICFSQSSRPSVDMFGND